MCCIRMGFILKEKEMNKYKTIIQDILSGIEKGDFKRGQKLPSIRKLSEKYQCSKDTVQKAMLELKYQNAIYAVEKSGYYILEDKDFQEAILDLDPADGPAALAAHGLLPGAATGHAHPGGTRAVTPGILAQYLLPHRFLSRLCFHMHMQVPHTRLFLRYPGESTEAFLQSSQ